MPWPTYSERFLHHAAAGEWHYTVPPKTRMIITNLTVINYAAAGVVCSVALGPILLAYIVFQASTPTVDRQLRAVGYQGEVLTLTLSATGIHTTIGGYLMQDLSGRTGPPLAAAVKPIDPGRLEPEPFVA